MSNCVLSACPLLVRTEIFMQFLILQTVFELLKSNSVQKFLVFSYKSARIYQKDVKQCFMNSQRHHKLTRSYFMKGAERLRFLKSNEQ